MTHYEHWTSRGIPTPALACARVLEYAVVDESVVYESRTSLIVDGKELGRVPCLAICEEKQSGGVLLLHCERDWAVLGCSAHPSVSEAKDHAERNYSGLRRLWVDAGVTEEEAERYLDQLFGDNRCSLCGKRADLVNRLMKRGDEFVCDGCVPS